ncbi:hypothetical protein U1Q18_041511 [Sarracenia purpurea var. burkii]
MGDDLRKYVKKFQDFAVEYVCPGDSTGVHFLALIEAVRDLCNTIKSPIRPSTFRGDRAQASAAFSGTKQDRGRKVAEKQLRFTDEENSDLRKRPLPEHESEVNMRTGDDDVHDIED